MKLKTSGFHLWWLAVSGPSFLLLLPDPRQSLKLLLRKGRRTIIRTQCLRYSTLCGHRTAALQMLLIRIHHFYLRISARMVLARMVLAKIVSARIAMVDECSFASPYSLTEFESLQWCW